MQTHTHCCSAYTHKLFHYLLVGEERMDTSIFACINPQSIPYPIGKKDVHLTTSTGYEYFHQWTDSGWPNVDCLLTVLLLEGKSEISILFLLAGCCRKLPWTLLTLRSITTQVWWGRTATKPFYPVSPAFTQLGSVTVKRLCHCKIDFKKTIFWLLKM